MDLVERTIENFRANRLEKLSEVDDARLVSIGVRSTEAGANSFWMSIVGDPAISQTKRGNYAIEGTGLALLLVTINNISRGIIQQKYDLPIIRTQDITDSTPNVERFTKYAQIFRPNRLVVPVYS